MVVVIKTDGQTDKQNLESQKTISIRNFQCEGALSGTLANTGLYRFILALRTAPISAQRNSTKCRK